MTSNRDIQRNSNANIAKIHRCKYVEIATWQFILQVAFHAAMRPVTWN